MPTTHANPNEFRVAANYAAAQTNTVLLAAPAVSGRSIYITDIIISADNTSTCKLVEDPAGTPANVLPPIYIGAGGGISAPGLRVPLKLTANKALGVTTTGAVNMTVVVLGFYEP